MRYIIISMIVSILIIAILYTIMYRVLHRYFAPFRMLATDDAQLVVIHHAIEAVVLSLLLVPFTYLTMSILFEDQDLVQLESKIVPLSTCLSTIIATYALELATRYRTLRSVLVLHHLVTISDGIFVLCFPSTATIKTAVILVYCIMFEVVTFFGLLMYRLFPYNKATPKIIIAGMIVMAASRPFQLILVLGSLLPSWTEIVTWHAIVQIIVTVIITTVQLYSLSIHYGLYKRCVKRQRERRTMSVSVVDFHDIELGNAEKDFFSKHRTERINTIPFLSESSSTPSNSGHEDKEGGKRGGDHELMVPEEK